MKSDAVLVPVSWRRMIHAVEKVRERLLRAVKALEEARLPYAVIGGNAVAAWVSRVDEAAVRNTRDVNILLRRTDLDAARRALEKAGFVYRRVASLGQPGGLDLFLDGPEASARDAVHVVFALEKVRSESPVPAPDVTESEPAEQFRLITLEGLVANLPCRRLPVGGVLTARESNTLRWPRRLATCETADWKSALRRTRTGCQPWDSRQQRTHGSRFGLRTDASRCC